MYMANSVNCSTRQLDPTNWIEKTIYTTPRHDSDRSLRTIDEPDVQWSSLPQSFGAEVWLPLHTVPGLHLDVIVDKN